MSGWVRFVIYTAIKKTGGERTTDGHPSGGDARAIRAFPVSAISFSIRHLVRPPADWVRFVIYSAARKRAVPPYRKPIHGRPFGDLIFTVPA
jgi:hypothetical protein